MAQTPEERKEKARLRMQAKRAAERAEIERELAAARKKAAADAEAHYMAHAVDAALQSMQWLKPSDGAAVAQARALAKIVDTANLDGEISKALSAHRALTRVLNDLGGTATVRLRAELRSRPRTQPEGTSDDDQGAKRRSNEATPAGGNVTQFKRPAKRRA